MPDEFHNKLVESHWMCSLHRCDIYEKRKKKGGIVSHHLWGAPGLIISKDYHDEENNFERDTLAKIMLLGGIEYMWYINGFNSTWSSVLKKSSSNKTSKSLYPRHPLSLSRGKKKNLWKE